MRRARALSGVLVFIIRDGNTGANSKAAGAVAKTARRKDVSDHGVSVSGQLWELSKKQFGKLAILTTKGPFLVNFGSYPKNNLENSRS
ncbi:MAG: hypothetical protein QM270_07485 [Bacillota bacterium]|nr:hypothetical protein [Bacillota bacterium]